jgi:hypothetical protein
MTPKAWSFVSPKVVLKNPAFVAAPALRLWRRPSLFAWNMLPAMMLPPSAGQNSLFLSGV